MNEPPFHKCLNCEVEFEYEFKFCPSCGQKNTDGKISFSELWSEFQDAVFNIESRTWRTFVAIFIPGKLTLEYFAGRHRRYVHPLRLLIITSLLIIIALSFHDVQSSTNHRYVIKDRILENYERQRAFGILKKIITNTNNNFPEPETKIITDTIKILFNDSLKALLHRRGDRYRDSIDLNSYISFSDEKPENILKSDFLTMTEDKLVEKYKKSAGPFDRLFFRQKAKLIKDESQLATGMVSRLSLVILLMMPFVAMALYLLYYRKRYYYIENLIFSFHMHAFSFIVLTIFILGWNIFPNWLYYLLFFIIEVYLFISMLKVYDQSIIKTIFKLMLLNVLYFVLLLLFLVGTFFISFFLL